MMSATNLRRREGEVRCGGMGQHERGDDKSGISKGKCKELYFLLPMD
jgi:hypothetical protein